jgi:diadenosine tetraphosphate (Ap4A) HIT family hydrolase
MYDKQNIFAKILRKEIPCEKVLENEEVLIFHDINPASPIHFVAIPKGEYKSFSDFAVNADADFTKKFWQSIEKVIQKTESLSDGYRLITNCGAKGGQTVPHFHVHILGGKQLGALVIGDQYH